MNDGLRWALVAVGYYAGYFAYEVVTAGRDRRVVAAAARSERVAADLRQMRSELAIFERLNRQCPHHPRKDCWR